MSLFRALILGIIQGITEFLPISSSGHLILIPHFLGWEKQSLIFDTALHLGTLLALFFVFCKKWLKMLKNKNYLILLIIGTLPAAIIGFLFEDFIKNKVRSPIVVSTTLLLVAILMFIAEKVGKKERGDDKLNLKDVLTIGFAQSLSLIPGVSRSGITITAGLFRDLKRDAAAEFSFLLGTPIIFGAGIFNIWELVRNPITVREVQTFGVGIFTATIIGFLTIKYFLKFLKNHTLHPFIWYRIALSLTIALFLL